jgi:hypothetical protein
MTLSEEERKTRHRERSRRYHEANREQRREARRRYYEANREQEREAGRRYHEANREQRREAGRRYYEANREQERERSRRYREANREQRREARRRYYEANRERHREWWRRYHEANREQRREARRRYYEANPEVARSGKHNRRARKRNATDPCQPVTAAIIARRNMLFGNVCCFCGAGGELTLEHVVALAKGGPHIPSNLAPSCKRCNSSKQDKPVETWYPRQPFFDSKRWEFLQAHTGNRWAVAKQLTLLDWL